MKLLLLLGWLNSVITFLLIEFSLAYFRHVIKVLIDRPSEKHSQSAADGGEDVHEGVDQILLGDDHGAAEVAKHNQSFIACIRI